MAERLRNRRAVVVGAGSFGTAVAVLLARAGVRTTLQTRTPEQARKLNSDRVNDAYLPDVPLPRELRVEPASAGLARADHHRTTIAKPFRHAGQPTSAALQRRGCT